MSLEDESNLNLNGNDGEEELASHLSQSSSTTGIGGDNRHSVESAIKGTRGPRRSDSNGRNVQVSLF